MSPFLFFFNDTSTTEFYTLPLHDALPIFFPPAAIAVFPRAVALLEIDQLHGQIAPPVRLPAILQRKLVHAIKDRKSTRLNSSHSQISYAVFCLKKKNRSASNTTIPRNIFT